ncbi:ABC transporter permease [Planctomicrobium sp. SH661]|uniref:ABC transporter permease n=1 Tax=Planctomicrobium sp. SH661 TaxID=3448124 RepID=UPI003F5C4B16
MSSASPGISSQKHPDSNRDSGNAGTASGDDSDWTLVITPRRSLFHVPVQELWEYRDLLWVLVNREIVSAYKQTILGPIWYVLQPLMTMLVFVVVFGNIAKIPTEGVPPALFYLSGIVIWNYFAESFTRTSNTFVQNVEIFGKVYFPRLIVPISLVVSGLIKFLIQFGIFLVILAYFAVTTRVTSFNLWLLSIPWLVLLMAGLALGFGILISAVTTKYRDLTFVVQFGVQLLMYATPIIYPMSMLGPRMRSVLWWNPIAHVVETFKYGFFGVGDVTWAGLAYACGFTVGLLLLGILIFNRTEQDFMDTV